MDRGSLSMPITESEVLNAVSVALGSPSESEYSTAAKQDALRRGLIQYSQFRPKRMFGNFQTVIDQQQYDIGSSYSYLIGITDVFYAPDDSISYTQYGSAVYDNIVPLTNSRNINTIEQEALRVIDNQITSVLQSGQRYDHHKVNDNTIALMPTPTIVKTVYFSYSLIKDISDLRESEYQDIIDFTFVVSGSDLSNIRSNRPLQMNTPDLGFIMFQSQKQLTSQITEVRDRLMKKFGVNSFVIHG